MKDMNGPAQDRPAAKRWLWEPDKVDLKFLFDHMRNYGIAGSVIAMAVLVSVRKTGYETILPPYVVSALFATIGLILMALNLLQGIFALRQTLRAGGRQRWLAVFWVVLLIAAVEFTLEAMMQANWMAWSK